MNDIPAPKAQDLIRKAKGLSDPARVFDLLREERRASELARESAAPREHEPLPRLRQSLRSEKVVQAVQAALKAGTFAIEPWVSHVWEGNEVALAMKQAGATEADWRRLARFLTENAQDKSHTALHPHTVSGLLPYDERGTWGGLVKLDDYPLPAGRMFRMLMPAIAAAVESVNHRSGDREFQWGVVVGRELSVFGNAQESLSYLRRHLPEIEQAVLSSALERCQDARSYAWLRSEGAGNLTFNGAASLLEAGMNLGFGKMVLADIPEGLREGVASIALNALAKRIASGYITEADWKARQRENLRMLLQAGATFYPDALNTQEKRSDKRVGQALDIVLEQGPAVVAENMPALTTLLAHAVRHGGSPGIDAIAGKLLASGIRLEAAQVKDLIDDERMHYEVALAAYEARAGRPEDPLLNARIDADRREAWDRRMTRRAA